MAMIADEILKAQKSRELETKFSTVRKGLRMSLVSFLKDNPSYEKLIDSFAGLDSSTGEASRNFLDDFRDIAELMDETFNKIGGAEDGALAHKLATVSAIYMERVGQACVEARINYFPLHKEKFSVYMSEEQEVKSLVPRTALKSIKMFLDKWFLVMQQYSVNAHAKIIYGKLSNFREKLHDFEYVMGKNVGKVKKEYAREIIPFTKDTKLALLRMRKLFEAVDASAFGKMINALWDVAMESGTRVYVKYNSIITVVINSIYKGSVIPLQTIVDKYDSVMFPVRQILAELETQFGGVKTKDHSKGFWDVSSQIATFRDGMRAVINEFSKGISPSDEDFKFFVYTVQTVLIPYMNQSRGEVNDTFIIGVKNLDTYFWKIVTKAIENGQPDGEHMDEILGLSVKVTQKDLDNFIAEHKNDSGIEDSIDEGLS